MNRFAKRMDNTPKSFIREILKVTTQPDMISFAGGLPNPLSFPVEAIRAACDTVLREDGPAALQYSTTEGYLPLREHIAARYRIKGIPARPEDILITSGSQQALDLIAKVFLDPGDAVVIEKPGYLGAIQAFSVFEPELIPVTLEPDGISVPALETALNRHHPKLFYAVPNFQNPSGISYTAEKRRRVAALLKDRDTVFVEDDPYGELRFMGSEAPSMGKLLEANRILLGTFSKIFSPAMRLGWIYAEPDVMEQLVTAKQAGDLHTNFFSQRVLYEYLRTNDIDEHIKSIRTLYKAQRDCMVSAIERCFPSDVSCTKPEGGMFLWLTLPEGVPATRLFDRAIGQKVAFVPGDPFYVGKKDVNAMRLNYSNASEPMIEAGVERLAQAYREMRD